MGVCGRRSVQGWTGGVDRRAHGRGHLGGVGPCPLSAAMMACGWAGGWRTWRPAEAFARQPDVVQRFYDLRRRQLLAPEIGPNPAHRALVELERRWPGPVVIVTQNIDDLHERAGSKDLIHVHGELLKARCTACTGVYPWHGDLAVAHRCPACGRRRAAAARGVVRRAAARAGRHLRRARGVRAVHRYRHVGPGLPGGRVHRGGSAPWTRAHRRAQPRAERARRLFAERRRGPASEVVPRYVDELLASVA